MPTGTSKEVKSPTWAQEKRNSVLKMISPQVAPVEYHHYVFNYLGERFGPDINCRLVEKPRQFRLTFFRRRTGKQIGEIYPDDLHTYLKELESSFSSILASHSPFFWMFLYRRIKPALSKAHDNKTDEQTTLLVRHIVDLAIAKFGNLEITNDIKRSSKMTLEKCWGGYLARAINELPRALREDASAAIVKDFETNDSFNPLLFRSTNYRDIFEVEGLAYEYWLGTARLRSLGKGSRLFFDRESGTFAYGLDADLEELLIRYDKRIESARFFSTLIGVVSDPESKDEALRSLLLLQYNVRGHDVLPVLKPMGLDVVSATNEPGTNFVPMFMSVLNFIKSHAYLTTAFQERWKFGLEDLTLVLWALSNLALVPNRYIELQDQPLGGYFLRLLKRGYSIYDTVGDKTYGSLRDRLNTWMGLEREAVDRIVAHAPKILEMISLTDAKQKEISLWSGGPRPVVIPYGDYIVIDVAAIAEFLRRVFTGIRDDGEIRGTEFEETVRGTIANNLPKSFEIGPRRIREGGTLKDEIDLLLRKGEWVYVCECFSMWRPLNYEIGEKETIAKRLKRIEKKLVQAEETCLYLHNHRIGNGYDYRDVKSFVPIVVSPFIEWVPSTDQRYWISDETPRVMSLDELLAFIRSA